MSNSSSNLLGEVCYSTFLWLDLHAGLKSSSHPSGFSYLKTWLLASPHSLFHTLDGLFSYCPEECHGWSVGNKTGTGGLHLTLHDASAVSMNTFCLILNGKFNLIFFVFRKCKPVHWHSFPTSGHPIVLISSMIWMSSQSKGERTAAVGALLGPPEEKIEFRSWWKQLTSSP